MIENNKPQSFAEITEDMIQEWKAKYGEYALEELSVPLNADMSRPLAEQEGVAYARFIMKSPDRKTVLVAKNYALKEDYDKCNQLLVENCVLGGDLKTIDQYGFVYLAVVTWGSKQMREFGSPGKKI